MSLAESRLPQHTHMTLHCVHPSVWLMLSALYQNESAVPEQLMLSCGSCKLLHAARCWHSHHTVTLSCQHCRKVYSIGAIMTMSLHCGTSSVSERQGGALHCLYQPVRMLSIQDVACNLSVNVESNRTKFTLFYGP